MFQKIQRKLFTIPKETRNRYAVSILFAGILFSSTWAIGITIQGKGANLLLGFPAFAGFYVSVATAYILNNPDALHLGVNEVYEKALDEAKEKRLKDRGL